jgi:hypothetical protein
LNAGKKDDDERWLDRIKRNYRTEGEAEKENGYTSDNAKLRRGKRKEKREKRKDPKNERRLKVME